MLGRALEVMASEEAELAKLKWNHARQRPLFLVHDKENLRQRRSDMALWAHPITKWCNIPLTQMQSFPLFQITNTPVCRDQYSGKHVRVFRHRPLKRAKGTAVQLHSTLPAWCLDSSWKTLRNKKKMQTLAFFLRIHDPVDLRWGKEEFFKLWG